MVTARRTVLPAAAEAAATVGRSAEAGVAVLLPALVAAMALASTVVVALVPAAAVQQVLPPRLLHVSDALPSGRSTAQSPGAVGASGQ